MIRAPAPGWPPAPCCRVVIFYTATLLLFHWQSAGRWGRHWRCQECAQQRGTLYTVSLYADSDATPIPTETPLPCDRLASRLLPPPDCSGVSSNGCVRGLLQRLSCAKVRNHPGARLCRGRRRRPPHPWLLVNGRRALANRHARAPLLLCSILCPFEHPSSSSSAWSPSNSHVRSIYSKLGVTSRAAATRYAAEHHLL